MPPLTQSSWLVSVGALWVWHLTVTSAELHLNATRWGQYASWGAGCTCGHGGPGRHRARGSDQMAREPLNEWINGPKHTLAHCGDFYSSEPASSVSSLWNRKEARDETLANRGNSGSRVVLKRDRACFKDGQARASPHSYHVL